MNKNINLASININQLNVLYTVLKEKNLTTAAKKLNLSQPTVSYGIKYLRDIFDDELFYKHPFSASMTLTPFCKTILEPLERIIGQMDDLLNKRKFDPNQDKRKFNIAITDYASSLLMPELYKKINKVNKAISFETFYFDYKNIAAIIELNDVDIAVGAFENFSQEKNVKFELLFSDSIGCIMSNKHALAGNDILSLDDFKKFPRLTHKTPIFKNIEPYKIEYSDYTFISNNNIANLSLIAESDLIGISGKKIIDKLGELYGVKWIDADFIKNKNFDVLACINKKNTEDKALQWLISVLQSLY